MRIRLLWAAAEVFARKGYAAASVNEIVEAAGVTKPVLYYYFQNKEGIFHAIWADVSRDLQNLLQTAQQNQGDVKTLIIQLLASLFTLCKENIQIVRMMYALHYGPPQGAPEHDLEVYHKGFEDAVKAMVQEGIESGELAAWDPLETTWAILGIFDTAMELMLCHPQVGFDEDRLIKLLQILFKGVEPGSQSK